MSVINFLIYYAARMPQSSKKMTTNLSENGYIHEFGFIRLHVGKKPLATQLFNSSSDSES